VAEIAPKGPTSPQIPSKPPKPLESKKGNILSSSAHPQQSSSSPFVKMFAKTGADGDQIKRMIDFLLKDICSQIKKDEARAKEAARKMKKVFEDRQ
jgi:hypothetical protein